MQSFARYACDLVTLNKTIMKKMLFAIMIVLLFRPCWAQLSNGSFETGDFGGWKNSSPKAAILQSSFDGDFRLHHSSTSKFDLYTTQRIYLQDGVYRFSAAAAKSDGVFKDAGIFVRTSDGNTQKVDAFNSRWQQLVIENIEVRDGYVELGAHSSGGPNSWVAFDNFRLERTGDLITKDENSPFQFSVWKSAQGEVHLKVESGIIDRNRNTIPVSVISADGYLNFRTHLSAANLVEPNQYAFDFPGKPGIYIVRIGNATKKIYLK
jgi:hypothetical protein